MSTPDPLAPPPRKRNPLLVGCLVILALLVLGTGAVLLLGIYAAKREYDAIAPQATQALEEARKAAAQVQAATAGAQALSQAGETQARLAMATREVASPQGMSVVACPSDPARVAVPVDAEWYRSLGAGLPREPIGTPWLRHQVFANLAAAGTDPDASEASIAKATMAADRDLSDAGMVAVIHQSKLQPPRVGPDGKLVPGRFEGFVQLIRYPTGESQCLVAFEADSPAKGGGGLGIGRRVRGLGVGAGGTATSAQQRAEEDFEGAVWAAEEAALGK